MERRTLSHGQPIQSLHSCFVDVTVVNQESVLGMPFLDNWKKGIDWLDPTIRHDGGKL